MRATVLAESSLYFIFSPCSLRYSNVLETRGWCRTLPFFCNNFYDITSRFFFYINDGNLCYRCVNVIVHLLYTCQVLVHSSINCVPLMVVTSADSLRAVRHPYNSCSQVSGYHKTSLTPTVKNFPGTTCKGKYQSMVNTKK